MAESVRRERGAVIVSGGTYGIGRAIVVELAIRGWPVVGFGLEALQPGSLAQDGIAGTRAALEAAGTRASLVEADVSSEIDIARVVAHAVDHYGGIEAVVNNAAIRPTGTVLGTDPGTFDRVMAVNLRGPFLLCRAAIPYLRARGGGTIINIGSGAERGKKGLAAYSASKAGLHALTMALAEDHRAERIRVHLVVPESGTASGMVEAMIASSADPDPALPARDSAPTGADVARVVAFLLSSDAEQTTGTVVDVDGYKAPA